MIEPCDKELSKDRLGAWQLKHMTDVHVEEVLGERPDVYLNSLP